MSLVNIKEHEFVEELEDAGSVLSRPAAIFYRTHCSVHVRAVSEHVTMKGPTLAVQLQGGRMERSYETLKKKKKKRRSENTAATDNEFPLSWYSSMRRKPVTWECCKGMLLVQ